MKALIGFRNFVGFVKFVVLFQIVTNMAVMLDIPFFRQIVGFIYLMFIPGFVILNTFKLAKEDLSETILFSIGLSITLLMLIGLFLNELFPMVGLASSLSTLPLLVTMNFVVILPCLWVYLKEISVPLGNPVVSRYLPLFAIIPILGILGTLIVNSFGNNSLLLLMLAVIAGLVTLGTICKKVLRTRFYLLAILAIAVALLLHSSLVTNYLVGWDIHSEYHVFKLTDNASYWNSTLASPDDRIGKGNAMLSVTILPTIYSKIAGIDGTWLFKILYPLILSFVPLALYKLYSSRMKKETAFLATFFIMSNLTFFGIDGFPAKQMIGEFFFVLLFLVILKGKIGGFEKSFFFIVFSAGLVLSHYSMSYIFLFLILLTWLSMIGMHFFNRSVQINMRITLSMITIFFVIAFAWYIYTSASASFDAIAEVGEQISRTFLVDFFSARARTATVLRGLGGGQTISILHGIGRIVFYIAEFFIILGVAKMLFRKEYASFGREYTMLSVLNVAMLMMCMIIPNFARYLRMERFYQISLLLLAPFFVIGGEMIFSFIFKRRSQAFALNLILIVLIPFFLFETGFLYEVAEDFSYSLPLSMYRMDRVLLYDVITNEKEVTAACWLSKQLDYSHGLVYADLISTSHVLTSYGEMSAEDFRVLLNTTQFTGKTNYIYLRGVNTIEGIMRASGLYLWNLSDVRPILYNQNIIYSNGNSEILWVLGNASFVSP